VEKLLKALALIVVFTAVVHAAESARQLEGIKKKIEQQRQGLTQTKKKEDSVLGSLAKIDAELDKKRKELKTVSTGLQAILADLDKKEAELARIDASLAKRREWLQRRAAALYRWQRSGASVTLLTGAESVGELMRRERYLSAILASDRSQIDRLSEDAARETSLARELEDKRAAASLQKGRLSALEQSIRAERQKKEIILASIRREKESRQRALKELEQAALRLQKMIDELNRRSAGLPKQPRSGTGFEMLKGKLDYPVQGKIAGAFGKTLHPEFSAELFRNGIDIDAPIGEEVRAVEAGRVLFADRFSGYGKMMIIDHGERYYTVYGHLADIFKQAGEPVRRGEPIAQVGDSDSLAGSRLYFELRKDGKPVDPAPWFRK
jgi:septal ring factor EnvC (AmiA/AmiB activator)